MKRSEELLELDKILQSAASFAVLDAAKEAILALRPVHDLSAARRALDETEEASLLLFTLGAGRVEYFPPLGDALERAEKGATLSCAELLSAAKALRSLRLFAESVQISDGRTPMFSGLAAHVYFDRTLEREIGEKILSEDTVADTASEALYAIRSEMRALGERIRARLAQYLTGDEKKYLQDGVVTVRGDRYVIPVKAEYKRSIRGFIHDRSQSGATVFVEPEEVLEMNNELRDLAIDEQEEVERILKDLSRRLGLQRTRLADSIALLVEADTYYARAEYCYKLHCTKPVLEAKGSVAIVKGRHPLLDPKKAVPVSVGFGEDCGFLLLSGANTGGKTVTLKMCGLFCLMATCGFFVPAAEGTRLSVREVWCDVGDSQSIEENLSTFSSHILHLKEILEGAGEGDVVLIDEPGGGTDPEEGQAIARAVLLTLLEKGCRGIVTTHYSALKEFAYEHAGLMNGCMEFDAEDHRPLYRFRKGAPGSSNALAICTRLGLGEEVVGLARSFLSEGARAFERTLQAAEESRIRAEETARETALLKADWEARTAQLEKDEEKFRREREKFLTSAKADARRIVSERTVHAEELLAEIEAIFQKETLDERDLIRARTLKNKMGEEEREEVPQRGDPVDPKALRVGDLVRIGSMGTQGTVIALQPAKGTAEVQAGSLKVRVPFSDLFAAAPAEEKREIRVMRNVTAPAETKNEIDLIGMTTSEMEPELEKFLDAAVLANLSEVRIVHGMGTGKLRAAVHALLKKHHRVASFRLGKYGEGESGVTIVTLK